MTRDDPGKMEIQFLQRAIPEYFIGTGATRFDSDYAPQGSSDFAHLATTGGVEPTQVANFAVQVYRTIEDNQLAGGYTILVDKDGNERAVFFQ